MQNPCERRLAAIFHGWKPLTQKLPFQNENCCLVNCMTHARRKFAEPVDRFPDDCAFVIEKLGNAGLGERLFRWPSYSPSFEASRRAALFAAIRLVLSSVKIGNKPHPDR